MYWTKYYNLNLSETMSFIKIESNFDQYAKGYNFTEKAIYDEDGGIVGIRKQLVSMDIGLCQNNNVYHYVENPFNIDVNLRTGLTYFKECIDKSNGNFRIALQRYNCGDWNTDHNITPYSTIIYVRRVLNEKIKIIFYS
jgi:soluble lytic murein transglycosylase-like protein